MKRIIFFVLSILLLSSGILAKKTAALADEGFTTTGKSAYLMDYDSGYVIYTKNENERLPIASMTKIMLLDIVFESIEKGKLALDDYITISENAKSMGGSQVFLQSGGIYQVKDLIKSVIIASANDASVALAEEIAGSEADFVIMMNEKAKNMGLNNTLFSNCTGLPKPTQYSSAKDVAIMLKSLLRHKNYFDYSKIWLDEISHPDGSVTTLTNTNKLSRFYEGCDGGKTGFTSQSKFCLAATAKRGDTRLIAVTIGEESSKQRFANVSNMFNMAFGKYASKVVVDKALAIDQKIPIIGAKDEEINVFPAKNLTIFCKKGEKPEYTVLVRQNNKLRAPLKKGQVVGEITLYVNGVEYAKTNLITSCDVEAATFGDCYKKAAGNWQIAG
ncbi:MAG: D-alanyl-D-alanine carboxypeptidase [Clostridia bacterium]|nr:D-alanyl-D-alanine carboxypeptidase [Clostridia bacterium]